MLEDRTLRILCISVLLAAAGACIATMLCGVAMSFGLGFPITLGLIVAGWSTSYDRNRPGRSWRRHVPPGLNAVFLAAIVAGIALVFFGANMPSAVSLSGQPAHHINAYVEQGTCWAVFNKDAPIEMPADFCTSFNERFGAFFSGGWFFLTGLVSSQAWRRSSTSET